MLETQAHGAVGPLPFQAKNPPISSDGFAEGRHVPFRSIEHLQGSLRVTVGRTLTLQDTGLIRDALSQGQGNGQITLDMRRTRSLEPTVLVALGTAIARKGVRVLGLDSSSESLLKRLGIDIFRESTRDDTPPEGVLSE